MIFLTSNVKLGVSLYSYGADIYRKRISVEEAIEHAASLGVEGIELVNKLHIPNLPNSTVYDLLSLKDYIESFGMKVSCFSTYVEDMIRSDRKATFKDLIRKVLEQIAQANILGAKIIRPTIAPNLEDWKKGPSALFAIIEKISNIAFQIANSKQILSE